MDRLIALVLLRWRLDVRAMARSGERVVGLFFVLAGLLLFSLIGASFAFFGVRSLVAGDPALVLPLLSLLATMVGLFWMLSPLVAGMALTESHDVSRLLQFPIPLPTLVVSSLIANLAQPLVLAEIPILLALGLAVSDGLAHLPLSLAGLFLTFLLILAATQVAGLVLHGLSRNRRLQDLSLFLGIGLGFVLSLLPMLFLWGGARPLLAVARNVRGTDVFALSPFAWGVRAAVLGGRGEVGGFLVHAVAAMAAIGAALALSSALIHRIHRGELDLGGPRGGLVGRPARMILPGALGALVEKDVRVAWRDPALKASLFLGLVGPVFFLFFLSRMGGAQGGRSLLFLALYVGASAFGANAFGLERRGIALLLGFPVARSRILVGKNLGSMVFRMPALLTLLVAGLLVAPAYLPAAATIALVGMTIAAGVDNYLSILFPFPAPAPGQNPYAGTSGGRGLVSFLITALMLLGAMLIASPFLFLAWLPLLLGLPGLWKATLPLALAGALSVYAMLVAGAAGLLERRETELLERVLGES